MSVPSRPAPRLPVSRTPTTSGRRRASGSPNMAPSASSPPTPQPSTPTALIIGVWLSVPRSVSGSTHGSPSIVSNATTGRQVLQIDGVHDAGARREHLEPAEIARCPFHEPVALGIAADLDAHVAREGTALAELVDADRVVGGGRDRTDRAQRRRVAAVLGDHVAHGGDIDQGRTAGRVVHQDPARPERDLDLGTGAGEPHDRIQGGLGRIRLARPQGILEQDPQAPRQRRESVTRGGAQIDETVRPSRKGERGRKTRRCRG